MREARLSLSSIEGTPWSARRGALSPDESPPPHAVWLHQALKELNTYLPIGEFLKTHFADRRYSELRRTIIGMVEGYDTADPRRASTLALRDESIANLTSSIMVGADALNVAGTEGSNRSPCNAARTAGRLLMEKAGLTIIFQRSWMDRHDCLAWHHVLDLQGRQRGVQPPENGEVLEHRLDHGIGQLIRLITR